ncbi:MAG: SMP-30/gluconolactonase/LRE family protein [Verrucomicrobiota bacterium]
MKLTFRPFIFTWIFAVAVFAVNPVTVGADFEIKNEAEFKKIIPVGAKLEKLAGGFKFTEGPAWIPGKPGYLIFSDIPANHLMKWSKETGASVFREDSHSANGNTIDRENHLLSAEHSGRRIAIADGADKPRTLVSDFEGKKFNSPNDVVVKSDGTVWFTDPDYGLGGGKREIEGNYVYRFDPKNKDVTAPAKDFDKPNGLCFSTDEKKLYVADSGKPHHIRVFAVQKDGTLANGKVFCVIDKGVPDGIRCDGQGRVWSSAGDGVQVFAPDGSLIGKILVPETPANLCFGGRDGKTLFITARSSLYAIEISQKN